MIHFRITSIDIWHQKLITDSLVAGLFGFSSEILSVGSFYNSITRHYNQGETSRVQTIGSNKNLKDMVKNGQKWENGTKGVVSSLIEEMSKKGYVFADSTLLQILKCIAVVPSSEKDLIN